MRNYINLADHSDDEYQRILYDFQIETEHDRGARSIKNVKLHTEWIHSKLLSENSSNILDIGCGIGLYSIELAKLGHSVAGIDISSYVIEYAKNNCPPSLNCKFIQSDIFQLDLNNKFDLVIFPYSVINTFIPENMEKFFAKVKSFLNFNGQFYFEGLQFNSNITSTINLYTKISDQIFNQNVNLILNDEVWDEIEKELCIYSYIVTKTNNIQKRVLKLNYYSHQDYINILKKHGFKSIEFIPSPPGTKDNDGLDYESILAKY